MPIGVVNIPGNDMLSFPNPVNEVAARLVALGVVVLTTAALVTQQHWLLVPLAAGFALRVLAGPRLSPLALLVTRVVVPRLGLAPRWVPGPPKRFAQGIGLAVSGTAAVLALGLDLDRAAGAVLAVLLVAASLEAFAGFCLGCRVFALLARAGMVPEAVCDRCANIALPAA